MEDVGEGANILLDFADIMHAVGDFFLQVGAGFTGDAGEGTEGQGNGDELLTGDVMEVAGNAAALLILNAKYAGGEQRKRAFALTSGFVGADEVSGIDGGKLNGVGTLEVDGSEDDADGAQAIGRFNLKRAFLTRQYSVLEGALKGAPTPGGNDLGEA